ncbi:DUF2577 domain-containing protein [Thermicanus aegyptius]|uniref:DUF2577 domain-containing protein n=1 Tax=Thermicanus aegyptius TaxID=94009 RepID=UPI00041E3A1E|nr:DUF2577 domain-containing protein [Thermicanus aegyptius]
MLNIIKQAALDALEAGQPVAVMFGAVTKTNPLEVNVDQRFTLSEDFLMQTNTAKYLQAGDKVVLLRIQGGQKYLILDKVVNG